MDHALQTISYIADIGDLLVIMVRLAVKPVASPAMMSVSNGAAGSTSDVEQQRHSRRVTICCHVFESDEVSQSRRSHRYKLLFGLSPFPKCIIIMCL